MTRLEIVTLVVTALAIVATLGQCAYSLAGEPIRVIDGDTIRIGDERIRIMGIDTPEKPPRAKCRQEEEGAARATAYLREAISGGEVTIDRDGLDRYGRTLARVYIDGRDIARIMVMEGLGREYHGGRREGWCE